MASLYVLVYSFAMKYVLIFAAVVFLMRIDFWLNLIEEATNKYGKSLESQPRIEAENIQTKREVISVSEDKSLKQTPKMRFLALLNDFHDKPSATTRESALQIFKSSPAIFGQKLDRELESQIFNWRDLLTNNHPESAKFMVDLMNLLQGENLEMMKRFFSLWMGVNMDHFLTAYSKTKDVNCTIAQVFGDNLSEDEKVNEFYEREAALKVIMANEKTPPPEKILATNCLIVIGTELEKRNMKPDLPAPEPIQPEPTQTGVSP